MESRDEWIFRMMIKAAAGQFKGLGGFFVRVLSHLPQRTRRCAEVGIIEKLSRKKVGLLLNFNVVQMKDGIKRMVNHL